jgi:hypothetical protein
MKKQELILKAEYINNFLYDESDLYCKLIVTEKQVIINIASKIFGYLKSHIVDRFNKSYQESIFYNDFLKCKEKIDYETSNFGLNVKISIYKNINTDKIIESFSFHPILDIENTEWLYPKKNRYEFINNKGLIEYINKLEGQAKSLNSKNTNYEGLLGRLTLSNYKLISKNIYSFEEFFILLEFLNGIDDSANYFLDLMNDDLKSLY